eukprot:2747554-Pyramimonas_sp.AAC.1
MAPSFSSRATAVAPLFSPGSCKGDTPVAGTNHRRRERICLWRAPIAEGKRVYTRSVHQSQKEADTRSQLCGVTTSVLESPVHL